MPADPNYRYQLTESGRQALRGVTVSPTLSPEEADILARSARAVLLHMDPSDGRRPALARALDRLIEAGGKPPRSAMKVTLELEHMAEVARRVIR